MAWFLSCEEPRFKKERKEKDMKVKGEIFEKNKGASAERRDKTG
jgi:hypothetical protein